MLWIVAVMIREPPAAPTEIYREPSGYSMTTGVIEERGRLPGRMKFEGEGTKPNAFVTLGMEKSFISLLRMIPGSWSVIESTSGRMQTNRFQAQAPGIQKAGLSSMLKLWTSQKHLP